MHNDTRRLVVMRHAKAEQLGPSDLERQLTRRGHDEAAEAGRWLAARGFVPDHALVSSAVRTRETWAEVSGAAGWSLEPDFQSALYAAGPESALDLLRLLPRTATSVLVLGHNPTVAYLAQLLSDGQGDQDAHRQMATGFPPAAVAVFEHTGEWAGLDIAAARLTGFHVGHG